MHTGWRWFWRVIAFAAVILSALALALFWLQWHEAPPLPTYQGKAIPPTLDVIALQLSLLSVAMTAIGIGIGVMALFGYQSIRSAAEGEARVIAEKYAREIADRVATEAVAKHIENMSAANDRLRGKVISDSVSIGHTTEMPQERG